MKTKKHFTTLFALLLGLLCFQARAQTRPAGFVYAQDTSFRMDGEPFYFSGTNNYYLMYKPNSMVIDILDAAVELNLKAIRMWGFMDGTSQGNQGYHDGYALQRFPGQYDSTGLHKIDSVVAFARERDLKLVITFVNYWQDFGGMQEYVTWAQQAGETVNGKDSFYTNGYCKQVFKNYVSYFINRTNHVTGIAYKDDPTIMAWQLTNEARSGDKTGKIVTDWAEEMSDFIRSIDPWHMISVGDEGGFAYPYDYFPGSDQLHRGGEYRGNFGTDWLELMKLPNIDYMTYHNYGMDWWSKDLEWSVEWVKYHIQEAHKANKPAVQEEYSKRIEGGYTEDKDIIRYEAMKPLQDMVYAQRGAADFSWMLTGINTWDPDPGDEMPLYRDKWPDTFQYTKYDPLVAPMLKAHAERMWNLNISEAPAAFAQLTPAANASDVSVLPVLTWEKATNATGYSLVVSENSDFSNPVIDETEIKDLTYSVTTQLAFEKDYYWKVTALNFIGGTEATNAGIQFTTQAQPPLPGSFALISPQGNGVTNTGTLFSWEASPEADKYELIVASDPGFTDVVLSESAILGTDFTSSSNLGFGKNYHWQVIARNITGTTTSNSLSFMTRLPPPGIDNFESYADCAAVAATWIRNTNGGDVTVCPDTSETGEGTQSMKLTYDFSSYAGIVRSTGNTEWTGYNGIGFWLKADDSGRDLLIQFKEQLGDYNGEYWEASVSLTGTAGQEIFIPFGDFQKPSWNSDGNGILELDNITEFGIYFGGESGNGVIYVDNFRLVLNGISNQSPVAKAGEDQTVQDEDENGLETVNLDASASTDSDGQIVAYEWKLGEEVIGSDAVISYDFEVGEHVATVTVTDNDGLTDSDDVLIVVNSGQVAANLALNKPVTVSSNDNYADGAAAATDGNIATRWSGAYADNEWIYVDLGQVYSLAQVVLKWETAYGRGYEIQVAEAGPDNWLPVYTESNGNGNTDVINLDNVSARYVRMLGTQRGTQWGYSLWELEVYEAMPEVENAASEGLSQVDIRLYPVPSVQQLRIKIQHAEIPESPYQLVIYNSQGFEVIHRDHIQGDRPEIDLSSLPSGIYTLRLWGNGLNTLKKIVKD